MGSSSLHKLCLLRQLNGFNFTVSFGAGILETGNGFEWRTLRWLNLFFPAYAFESIGGAFLSWCKFDVAVSLSDNIQKIAKQWCFAWKEFFVCGRPFVETKECSEWKTKWNVSSSSCIVISFSLSGLSRYLSLFICSVLSPLYKKTSLLSLSLHLPMLLFAHNLNLRLHSSTAYHRS